MLVLYAARVHSNIYIYIYIQQHVTLEARIISDLFFVYKPFSSHAHFSFVTEKDLQGENI